MKQQGVKYAYNDKWHYFILFAETEIQGRPKCAGSAVFVNLSILIIFCTNTNSPAYYNINNGGQDILGSAGDQWQHSNRQSRTSRDLISEHQCFRLPDDWSQTRNTFCGTWYLSHCHTLLTTEASCMRTSICNWVRLQLVLLTQGVGSLYCRLIVIHFFSPGTTESYDVVGVVASPV